MLDPVPVFIQVSDPKPVFTRVLDPDPVFIQFSDSDPVYITGRIQNPTRSVKKTVALDSCKDLERD